MYALRLNSHRLLLLSIFFQTQVLAQCGSLVTYRQHADLLQSAPGCLRAGCSQNDSGRTIQTTCALSSPCSAYWNMFVTQFENEHGWCSGCKSDVACRIPGWPVMNATALCQSAPNQVLFGDGGCCNQGNEPFELAQWTGAFCNGSEWRQQFERCGGMACLDWREWIMPWNWTVQNTTLQENEQDCKAPHRYLAVYAYEHISWLVFSIGIGALRLWIARHEEHKNRSFFRYFLVVTWANLKSRKNSNEIIKEKLLDEGEDLRPAFTDPLKWSYPVIMGVFLAGLQLSFNFWVAHIIQSAPGYGDVPMHLLALLFCCRPRLSWLSCLLALISDERLEKIFNFKHGGDGIWAARLVLSSVAVSSAVAESIMQLLGSYFLGTTANIGRQRGFFIVHRLRPKMWGRDARRMYIGALCWVMLCIPLLVVWFLVALFSGIVFHAVSSWRRGIFNFLRNKTSDEKVPKFVKNIVDKIDPGPDPATITSSNTHPPHDLPREYFAPDQPYPAKPLDPFTDQPTRYNGPASGDLFNNDLPMPVRYEGRRKQYPQLTQFDFEDQPMRAHQSAYESQRVASAGYAYSPSAVQRRTPSGGQYGVLAQADHDMESVDVPRNYAQNLSVVQRRAGGGSQYQSVAQIDDPETIVANDDQPYAVHKSSPPRVEGPQPSHHGSSSATLLMTTAESLNPEKASSSIANESSNGSSNKRADYKHNVNWKWQGWEKKIIWAGAFLGMLAYAAQWVFWDGFIKVAGDRFCPPNLGTVSGVWGGGAVLCKSSRAYIGLY